MKVFLILAFSLKELVFLNGFGAFGDNGKLTTGRGIISPRSTLGFSLKVEWQDNPGPPHWWSVRLGIGKGATEGYDRLAFDIYIERANEKARLLIFLYEPDDDRWVAFARKLSELEPRKWHHFEVKKEEMHPWLLGDKKQEWDSIWGLAIEPNGDGGECIFYLDAIELKGPKGERALFTIGDDGYQPEPGWNFPVRRPGPENKVYLPFDFGRLHNPAFRRTVLKLHKIIPNLGVPISGFGRRLPEIASELKDAGVVVIHYSPALAGYARFLTRRQAWEVDWRGRSVNSVPGPLANWHWIHSPSYPHPATLEAVRRKIDALTRAGIGAWMVVDFVWPWWGGRWGYSKATVAEFKRDLKGKDEGLHVVEGDSMKTLHFWDYFEAYTGLRFSPEDLGLTVWDEFEPAREPEVGDDPRRRRNLFVFLALRAYEWLKFAQRAGEYMRSKGGDGLWLILNPEDLGNASDYVFAVRLAGVGNVFPEYFGNVGLSSDAAYHSLPYLQEEADRGGTRLSLISETGVGGHARPYHDWQVAYCGVYDLTASGNFDDFDNDFLDEAPFEVMSNPDRNPYQFDRFRDGIAKAFAFNRCKLDKPCRKRSAVLSVSLRPINHYEPDMFFSLNQRFQFSKALAECHFAFDWRDTLWLERVLAKYRIVFYAPTEHPRGQLSTLRQWLRSGDGRVLITHSFVPISPMDGVKFFRWRPPERGSCSLLELGEIRAVDILTGRLTEVHPAFRGLFEEGEEIRLPGPLYVPEHGKPLIRLNGIPLISKVRVGRGWVFYIGYTVGTPGTRELDRRVVSGIMRLLGEKPEVLADWTTIAHVYDLQGGGRVCVLWHRPTLEGYKFAYRPDVGRLRYEASGAAFEVQIPVKPGRWIVYDFLSHKTRLVEAGSEGYVKLNVKGKVCGLFYLLPATPQSRKFLQSLLTFRHRMAALFREHL